MQGKASRNQDVFAAIDAHERFVLGKPGGARADLRFLTAPGIDLSNRRLAHIELSGANLSGANLSGSDLSNASLNCADITGANLSDAKLSRADFRGARLQGVNFEFADMDGADFRQSTIAVIDRNGKWAVHGGVRVPTVTFTNCSLKKARLNNANLKNARFDGALLTGAIFAGAVLENASFDGAVLIGVNLAELRVPPESLKNCITDPSRALWAKLPEYLAQLDQAEKFVHTQGREGKPANFEGHDIRLLAQHMRGRALTGINLKKTIAVSTDFTGCQLQAAKLDGADLRGAIFTEADLRGASFAGANLAHADFSKTDLAALMLEGGTQIETIFDGAILDHTNFYDARR
jgi:uncharacterized protein YjbI with pentapeptide repeats